MKTLEALFTSEVRLRALRRLVLSGVQQIPERDLAREEELPLGAMRRELERLGRVGLVRSSLSKRRRFYGMNTGHPYYRELKALILKTIFLETKLRKLPEIRRKIRVAFVFGSTARGEEDKESDLDLAVIGDAPAAELLDLLDPPPGLLGREFNPTVYSPGEFTTKYREPGSFVERIVKAPKIFIVGTEDDLTKILDQEAARQG
jgi:predicted nucleotidyltransferase